MLNSFLCIFNANLRPIIIKWNQDNTALIDDAKSLLNAAKYDSISHMIFVVFFILFLNHTCNFSYNKKQNVCFYRIDSQRYTLGMVYSYFAAT